MIEGHRPKFVALAFFHVLDTFLPVILLLVVGFACLPTGRVSNVTAGALAVAPLASCSTYVVYCIFRLFFFIILRIIHSFTFSYDGYPSSGAILPG